MIIINSNLVVHHNLQYMIFTRNLFLPIRLSPRHAVAPPGARHNGGLVPAGDDLR